jgi:glycogen debranching enzyme
MAVILPSAAPFAPGFEPKRYWRGPAWPIVNWMLIDGCRRNGLDGLAERLRSSILSAIERSGFVEYFDPTTGEGCGGDRFSWTAATFLALQMKP